MSSKTTVESENVPTTSEDATQGSHMQPNLVPVSPSAGEPRPSRHEIPGQLGTEEKEEISAYPLESDDNVDTSCQLPSSQANQNAIPLAPAGETGKDWSVSPVRQPYAAASPKSQKKGKSVMLNESSKMTDTTFREDASGLDHSTATNTARQKVTGMPSIASKPSSSSSSPSRKGRRYNPFALFTKASLPPPRAALDLEAGASGGPLGSISTVVTSTSRVPLVAEDSGNPRGPGREAGREVEACSDLSDTSLQELREEEQRIWRAQLIFAVAFTIILSVGIALIVYFQLQIDA